MNQKNNDLMGFNIYRDGILINNELVTVNNYQDLPAQTGYYCYTVTALYDLCGESDPSNEECIDFHVGIHNNDLSDVKIYPNPSNSILNIELTSNVSQVVIYNYLGQVVLENNITDETLLHIDLRNYDAGAYLVRFITNKGQSLSKKLVVTK